MFNGNTKTLKSNIKKIFLKYLMKIVKKATRTAIAITLLTTYNNTVNDLE